jgi:hypothetical protein
MALPRSFAHQSNSRQPTAHVAALVGGVITLLLIATVTGAVIRRVAVLTPLAARLQGQHIAMDYEMTGARFQSSKRVLDILDTLARVDAPPRYIVDTLRYRYQRKYEIAQHVLDQLAEHFPDLITDMQERLARRLLLVTEADVIAQQAEHGTLPAPVAERMAEAIVRELRSL